MLSGHSFNALLKTLEEPPPHVKFLLATTDPQTFTHYDFITLFTISFKKHAGRNHCVAFTKHTCTRNIPFETPGLWQLARSADGSMRDALSLLDQAIAYGNGQVNEADIYAMLGTLPAQQLTPLIAALISENAPQLMQIIAELAAHGADFHQVLEELLSLLQQIAIAQVVPDAIDQHHSNKDNILAFATQISPENVQLYYQIALVGRRDLPFAPSPKMGFEMILLRMLVFKPDAVELVATKNSAANNQTTHHTQPQTAPNSAIMSATSVSNKTTNSSATSESNNAIHRNATHEQQINAANLALNNTATPTENNWTSILSHLHLSGMTLALANNCSLEKIEDNTVHLLLDPSHSALHNPRNDERLAQALQQYFNKPMKVLMRISTPNSATPAQQQQSAQLAKQAAAKTTIENDPGVQSLLKTFDAKIHPDSIQVLENAPIDAKD